MTRYLISFDDGAMNFREDELAELSVAAHRVVRDAQAAGVWITGGGLQTQQASIVDPDGSRRLGEFPERKAVLGGFALIDVASAEEALGWAARIAAACRCAQEVRVVMDDPEV